MMMRCAMCDALDGFWFDLILVREHLRDAHDIDVISGELDPGDLVVLS
jgi:hypothetical protein